MQALPVTAPASPLPPKREEAPDPQDARFGAVMASLLPFQAAPAPEPPPRPEAAPLEAREAGVTPVKTEGPERRPEAPQASKTETSAPEAPTGHVEAPTPAEVPSTPHLSALQTAPEVPSPLAIGIPPAPVAGADLSNPAPVPLPMGVPSAGPTALPAPAVDPPAAVPAAPLAAPLIPTASPLPAAGEPLAAAAAPEALAPPPVERTLRAQQPAAPTPQATEATPAPLPGPGISRSLPEAPKAAAPAHSQAQAQVPPAPSGASKPQGEGRPLPAEAAAPDTPPTPRADAPRTEGPRVEGPKIEPSRAEAPRPASPALTRESLSVPAPAMAAPVAEVAPTARALPSPVVAQVEGTLRWMVKGPVPEARLQLHPESLGKVSIELKVEQGQVHAKVLVQEPAALQTLQEGRASLEAALKQSGLQLGSFDLQQGGDASRHAPEPRQVPLPPGRAEDPARMIARQEAPPGAPPRGANPRRIEIYA